MALSLSSKPGVDNTDANYPLGKITDSTGPGTGTPVNALVYQDVHQFFARLLQKIGTVANNNPDNQANGYQLVDALDTNINNLIAAVVNPITAAWSISYAAGTAAGAVGGGGISGTYIGFRTKLIGKTLIMKFRYNATISGVVSSINFLISTVVPGTTWQTSGFTLMGAVIAGSAAGIVTLGATDIGVNVKRADGTNFATGSVLIDVLFTAEIA